MIGRIQTIEVATENERQPMDVRLIIQSINQSISQSVSFLAWLSNKQLFSRTQRGGTVKR